MPYVDQELRDTVDADIERLCDTLLLHTELQDAPGVMNYIISRIASVEIRNNHRYITINEAMGVLTCVQQELFRRLAAGYEDQKCEENGDVFE